MASEHKKRKKSRIDIPNSLFLNRLLGISLAGCTLTIIHNLYSIKNNKSRSSGTVTYKVQFLDYTNYVEVPKWYKLKKNLRYTQYAYLFSEKVI